MSGRHNSQQVRRASLTLNAASGNSPGGHAGSAAVSKSQIPTARQQHYHQATAGVKNGKADKLNPIVEEKQQSQNGRGSNTKDKHHNGNKEKKEKEKIETDKYVQSDKLYEHDKPLTKKAEEKRAIQAEAALKHQKAEAAKIHKVRAPTQVQKVEATLKQQKVETVASAVNEENIISVTDEVNLIKEPVGGNKTSPSPSTDVEVKLTPPSDAKGNFSEKELDPKSVKKEKSKSVTPKKRSDNVEINKVDVNSIEPITKDILAESTIPNATSTPGKKHDIKMTPIRSVQKFSEISGRRSIRTFNDSYCDDNELNDTANSMNVTVGSEDRNVSSFSFFRFNRKRERTPSKLATVTVEQHEDIGLLSPPKRGRFEFGSSILNVISSPMTLLGKRFSKTSIENNIVSQVDTNVEDGHTEEVQNMSGVSIEEDILNVTDTSSSEIVSAKNDEKDIKNDTNKEVSDCSIANDDIVLTEKPINSAAKSNRNCLIM